MDYGRLRWAITILSDARSYKTKASLGIGWDENEKSCLPLCWKNKQHSVQKIQMKDNLNSHCTAQHIWTWYIRSKIKRIFEWPILKWSLTLSYCPDCGSGHQENQDQRCLPGHECMEEGRRPLEKQMLLPKQKHFLWNPKFSPSLEISVGQFVGYWHLLVYHYCDLTASFEEALWCRAPQWKERHTGRVHMPLSSSYKTGARPKRACETEIPTKQLLEWMSDIFLC